jgi:SAM-dependent methyltransferase
MRGDARRYLLAKETVDDRAFDPDIRERVRTDLAGRSGDVRLLDAGAGTAPFLRRLLDWPDPPDLTYVAVDADADVLRLGRDLTAAAARDRGWAVSDAAAFDGPGETVGSLSLRGESAIDARFVRGDALDAADAGGWTFVLAQAFVDLLGPAGVDRLLDGLAAGGRFYFPITFDGETAFSPSHEADAEVLSAYHDTMHGDDRLGSRAGRRLERHLGRRGVEFVAADADWAVRPVDGAYPADEAYFLRVIADTVADAVRGRVPAATRTAWHGARTAQLDERRLGYDAHNRDVTGRVD